MKELSFLHPAFLFLLLLLPVVFAWHFWQKDKQSPALKMSSLSGFNNSSTILSKLKPYLFVLRILALSFIIIALARPRTANISDQTKSTRGIDIVMAIDVSGSMLAKDLKPNRLEALKKVAYSFAESRTNDRLGIVVYAAESYTKTPVTSDKAIILESINDIQFDNIIQDGTGIGMGLSTAINRLKESKAKSKVIILLTDGVNNAGFIEPETAAQIASKYNIKVYTIGIGTNGNAPFPYGYSPTGEIMYKLMPVEIDEKVMRNIAKNTGGKYFRATDNQSLKEIYKSIDLLEKTEIKELKFYDYDELFRPFVIIAGLLLLLEFILKNTVFKSFI
jgi:Ca-activated chloride channel homolog